MSYELPAATRELFDGSRWYVWVIEYGITHGMMRLGMHREHFLRRIEIMCGDVWYIRGELQGEACVPELFEGEDGITIKARDGELEIRCRRIGTPVDVHPDLGP